MKRLIALLTALTVISASVFAGAPAGIVDAAEGDFFGDIAAVELTEEEAADVEGEGAIIVLVATFAGAAIGYGYATLIQHADRETANANGAAVGAICGAIAIVASIIVPTLP